MKVRVNDTEGYLPVSENAEITEAKEGEIEEIQKEAIESSKSFKRAQLVSYALQFVGGPYRYGGSDPRTGTDCSGFTRYVYQNGLGISLIVPQAVRQLRNIYQRFTDAAGRPAFLWKREEH
mgnify:CR=1 FL=1